ncbi:SgrR family transcriptional regulator [Cohnella sp. JJ-181]|uniref:SgrR family transcriptional regulator n=1 Tax=Cohnella rhizoplanae TaxID=2974897 RepID=UPI0022FF9A71|nr:SgrR family transcriptional regulator [Cohnella sp. JJ-181]CAI6081453.1 HTH-type transcriptional regulator SgrR [Cohnella sp. JJ-181]
MLAAERYLTLYDRFEGGRALGEPTEATLEELAEALYCTARNAKLVLKRLEEEGLVAWMPGRGRGNRSRIVFHADKEDFLFDLATTKAEQGDYRLSFELLSTYGAGTDAKTRFIDWLNVRFGYQKETVRGRTDCDTLRIPVYRQVQTLDPGSANFAFDGHLMYHIFDRLVTFDESLGRIVPGVAHAWSSDPAGMEWTFYLRKGVHFHDGRELTSEDVVFTFERLRRTGVPNRWMMRSLLRVDALGPRTVRFSLSRPNRIFDRYLCAAAASILPLDLRGVGDAYWRLPVGTGAFRLVTLSPHRIELIANTAYYAGRPFLDCVDIVIMPEDCRELSTTGMPSVMRAPDGEDPAVDGLDPGTDWQALARLCNGCTMLTWNTNKDGWQQNEALRKAVRMMLDPVAMQADLGGERALPAYGIRAEDSLKYIAKSAAEPQIRETLRLAGYDGAALRLVVHEKYELDGRWIADRLERFGVNVELVVADWKQAVDPAVVASGDFTVSGIVLAEDEVCEIDLYEHEACLTSAYLNATLKTWIVERIDRALAAYSPEERRSHMREIENRLREECYIIFLHHRRLSTHMHPSVRGASFSPQGWIDFKQIWLEKVV